MKMFYSLVLNCFGSYGDVYIDIAKMSHRLNNVLITVLVVSVIDLTYLPVDWSDLSKLFLRLGSLCRRLGNRTIPVVKET